MTKDELLDKIKVPEGVMTLRQKLKLVMLLSVPSMIAQLSSIIMEIIDASMLGHIGTHEAAAVGLVSTTMWLFLGFISAFGAGFSVQVAHKIGGNDAKRARSIVRQGIGCGILFGGLMMLTALAIAPYLPHWLGATDEICADATKYFTIVAIALPLFQMYTLAAGCLRCSGDIKTPSMIGVMMCALDVMFNYVFIYEMDMGVEGAAWGTFVATVLSSILMLYFATVRDRHLRLSIDGKTMQMHLFRPHKDTLREALRIGGPISMERGVMCGALIAISGIIAPMGAVALAANTFGINVESLCYMPGHGVAEAATTLVGQSKGAKRKDLMDSFAWISMGLGITIMAFMGLIMGVFAPEMMSAVTNDAQVITLGAEVLRIEAWAEPGFAAAIVGFGIFMGAGRTLLPSIMNLGSVWVVRFTLACLLAPTMGLRGVWIAMATELVWRGLSFFILLLSRTIKKSNQSQPQTSPKNTKLLIL